MECSAGKRRIHPAHAKTKSPDGAKIRASSSEPPSPNRQRMTQVRRRLAVGRAKVATGWLQQRHSYNWSHSWVSNACTQYGRSRCIPSASCSLGLAGVSTGLKQHVRTRCRRRVMCRRCCVRGRLVSLPSLFRKLTDNVCLPSGFDTTINRRLKSTRTFDRRIRLFPRTRSNRALRAPLSFCLLPLLASIGTTTGHGDLLQFNHRFLSTMGAETVVIG